jgi:hypothetical protein
MLAGLWGYVGSGLDELIGLALMADRYQVEANQDDLEEAVMNLLTVESCGRILTTASGSGLDRCEGTLAGHTGHACLRCRPTQQGRPSTSRGWP